MALIFLNGVISSGKTSIAGALQDQLVRPYCVTGIDDAFAMLPVRLHNNPDGFYFDRDERDLGPVDKGDSQEDQYVIQGGFWGGYRDPRFDERRGMGLP